MEPFHPLGGCYLAGMNFVAMDRDGHHAGFSSYENASYAHMDASMDAPELLPRTHVAVSQRWDRRDLG